MDLQRFSAVCFDFDGTLADNFGAIAAAANHVRAARHLQPLSVPEVKHFVGRGIDYLVENTIGGDVPQAIAAYRAYFPKVMRTGTTLLPGASELLRRLYDAGIKIALCSNKLSQYSRELLQYLGVADYFSAVFGPEDVGRPKPAPDMLFAAINILGVNAAHTLYIGDMVVDIETARAAGVTVWVVPTGTESCPTLANARPDRLLDSLWELANHIG